MEITFNSLCSVFYFPSLLVIEKLNTNFDTNCVHLTKKLVMDPFELCSMAFIFGIYYRTR